MTDERIDCRTVAEIEDGKLYVHPNARFVRMCFEGCCDYYECPDCGIDFRVEAPD